MTSPLQTDRPVLIIGAGIGGLSSAIILARLGFDVTVIEKNRDPGGLMRSHTRDGIECSVGIHYLGSLGEDQVLRKFFDYLGVTTRIPVTRMGQNGIIDRYLFDSPGTHPSTFDVPEGFDAFEKNLIQAFPAEQKQIDELMKPIRRAAGHLHDLDYLRSVENDLSMLDQSIPLGEILDQLGCSPGLRSVMAVPSCWIGVPLNDCPAYYHNIALASYLSSSWRLNCSGSQMAEVFADRLRELGGKIITAETVERIRVSSRVVRGVHLKSGPKLEAPIVIGAVHPKVVLDMLPEGAVRPSYRKRISSLKDTHGISCVHVRLDADAHKEIPHNVFKVQTDADGNVPNLTYYQIRKSEKPGYSLLSILGSGKSELWRPWENTKSGRRGEDYRETKRKEARRLIREAEKLFGNLKGHKVIDTYTPLTLRDWVNSPGGSAYGVLRSSSQMLSTALLNRTSVKGLYLAGQSVMAPGAIGTIMGSFSTVKALLGAKEFKNQIRL